MTGDGTKMYAVAQSTNFAPTSPSPPIPGGIYTNFLPTVTRQRLASAAPVDAEKKPHTHTHTHTLTGACCLCQAAPTAVDI